MLLAGYSNNSIAHELNFSLKNIESIISKLFRRSGIITKGGHARLINPRVKLLVDGLSREWLRYQLDDKAYPLDFLTRNQYLSLLLCGAGCSNHSIAEFLCISTKTVESRLNSLFHQFAVNVQLDKEINPRIRLLVNALIKRVLTFSAVIRAHELLDFANWEQVLNNRDQVKDELLKLQLEPSKPQHLLGQEANVASLYEYAVNTLAQSSNQRPMPSADFAPPVMAPNAQNRLMPPYGMLPTQNNNLAAMRPGLFPAPPLPHYYGGQQQPAGPQTAAYPPYPAAAQPPAEPVSAAPQQAPANNKNWG